ncbi:MAG: transposase [Halioglobus sp.]|nr:transposase [Halioglobus sp.]
MPRRARMYLPGLPYHLFQRGNNRTACFFEAEDRTRYLRLLGESCESYQVDLHAYVLMTNHVHLLLTPTCEDSISRMTRVVGSRYAQFVNKKYGRSGTLWEGRHKSCPVETSSYLLKCYRYIELNPVRAKMVTLPEDYPWSSYAGNALGAASDLLSPHPVYTGLGATVEERCCAYREIVGQALNEGDLQVIRGATHYCSPLGGPRFRAHIETELGAPVGQQGRGRPRKRGAG